MLPLQREKPDHTIRFSQGHMDNKWRELVSRETRTVLLVSIVFYSQKAPMGLSPHLTVAGYNSTFNTCVRVALPLGLSSLCS